MNTYKIEFGKSEAELQILSEPLEDKKDPRSKSRTASENDVTTIEDCLKAIYLQGNDVNSKTQVSVLQEVLQSHGTTPNYELVRIEGTRHEPIFKYRVWFDDKEAIGDGKSKREAKHSAAKAIINKLIGVDTDTTTSLSSDTIILSDLNSSLENNVFGNAIGWLQELCVARHWAPPMYEIDFEMDRPRDRQFIISCIVAKHCEVGHGRSKKIAKLSAAHKMWLVIQKEVYAKSKAKLDFEDDGFFEALSPPVNHYTYYIQKLQEVAAAHQIDVKYKQIEKKTVSDGHFQCILELSTSPKTNCHGTGTSRTEAHMNAAHIAVKYLEYLFDV